MNIRITDTKGLQQQSTTRPAEINNADAFSQTLQQVQYAQVKPATQVVDISAAEIKTDASKQPNEAKRSVLDEFMDWMQMSDAEKIRDRILKGMGLTESYGQIWCTSIRRFSCLTAPLLVRRLGI